MPASFDIESSTGAYGINIAPGLLDSALAEPGDRIVIADDFLGPRLAAQGIDAVLLKAEEATKSLDRAGELIEALKVRGATRQTVLLAVGGGIVQDAVTFAASIYMRGLAWDLVPTTLLSMADSCIGGKSSINAGSFKNLVGNFHPPRKVLIDPGLAESLSQEQKTAGLCEAAKIAMCRSPQHFADYLALNPGASMPAEAMADVVELCLRAKKWFIEIDEFDRKERLILNFGHTFGHAVEAASHFAVSHGIAVGLGMIAARHFAADLGIASNDPRVEAFHSHIRTLLSGVSGLPQALAGMQEGDLMKAFDGDKKHTRSHYAVILINDQGLVERMMVERGEENAARVARAFAAAVAEFV